MKGKTLSDYRLLSWMFFLLFPQLDFGNECFQDPSLALISHESYLPRYIGSTKADAMRPFPALCDTMFVRKGDSSTIYAGTLFHFSNPSFRNRLIIVEGYLQLKGRPNLSVSLAGSINDTGLVLMAGGERWGGIKVLPEGRLDAQHVLLTGAETALDLRTHNVRVFEVRQKNCKIWIDSTRVIHALDFGSALPNFGTFNSDPGSTQAKSNWLNPTTYWWTGGVVGVATVSGIIAHSLVSNKGGEPVVKPSSEFGRTPTLPQDPQ